MKPFTLMIVFSLIPICGLTDDLPFDRTRINRYSLDGLPRSISVRQGADIWLGYDLNRAMVRKVWRAPQGKPGLSGGFTVRSVGKALFEDGSDAAWLLMKRGKKHQLKVRYLGCSQGEDHFELRWELQYGARRILLRERISSNADREAAAWRELRVEGLYTGEALRVPVEVAAVWKSTSGGATAALAGGRWIRLVIP